MKYFFIPLLAFTFSFHSISNAQIVKNVEDDIGSFFTTGGDMASSFFQFKPSTQIGLAESAALIGAGYSIDINVHDFAQRNKSSFNNKLFSIDNVYGNGYTLIGIGGLYGYGIIFNNTSVRKLGLQTIEAVGYAGLITSVLKAVVGRSRPYANEGKARFRPFNVHAAYTSFPSGHSTVSWAVSTVLANNTDNIYLKILCYAASTVVVGARIYHNAHWLSDTITGSAIGYFVGNYVSNKNKETNSSSSGLLLNVLPGGISLTYSF